MKWSTVVFMLAAVPVVCAQTAARPHLVPAKEPNPIPSAVASFDTSDGTSVALPSMVMTERPICYSADSCASDFAPDPHNITNLTAWVPARFGVSGKVRAINPQAIQGLYDVQILSSAPTDDGTAVLVEAATSGNGIDLRLVPKGNSRPESSDLTYSAYVCIFDHDGQPENVDKLDPRYRAGKIAYIGEDRILLLLFDKINDRAVMAVMKEDGQIVEFLDTHGKTSLPGQSALLRGSGAKLGPDSSDLWKRTALEASLTSWEIGYASKQLLIMQRGTNPIVWSISPGGEIRKVKLEMPPGTMADSILSSDGPWLIRSFDYPSPSGTQALLQFDPQTGKVLRRIDTKGVPPTTIMFAENGHYYAFWWDKSQHPWIVESR